MYLFRKEIFMLARGHAPHWFVLPAIFPFCHTVLCYCCLLSASGLRAGCGALQHSSCWGKSLFENITSCFWLFLSICCLRALCVVASCTSSSAAGSLLCSTTVFSLLNLLGPPLDQAGVFVSKSNWPGWKIDQGLMQPGRLVSGCRAAATGVLVEILARSPWYGQLLRTEIHPTPWSFPGFFLWMTGGQTETNIFQK